MVKPTWSPSIRVAYSSILSMEISLFYRCAVLSWSYGAGFWMRSTKARRDSGEPSNRRMLHQPLQASKVLSSRRCAGGTWPLKALHLLRRSAGWSWASWPKQLDWLQFAPVPAAAFAASFCHSILQLSILAATQCFSRLLNSCCAQSLR